MFVCYAILSKFSELILIIFDVDIVELFDPTSNTGYFFQKTPLQIWIREGKFVFARVSARVSWWYFKSFCLQQDKLEIYFTNLMLKLWQHVLTHVVIVLALDFWTRSQPIYRYNHWPILNLLSHFGLKCHCRQKPLIK